MLHPKCLTLFADMATGIGSVIAFFAKKSNYRFLSVATGFSAGVMLYVSFVEIYAKGTDALNGSFGDYWGTRRTRHLFSGHSSDRTGGQSDPLRRESA
jgi:zinc transporter ZupT